MIPRIKGTHDALDLRLFNFIINEAQEHLSHAHFAQIATPIIEPLELFKRTLGTYTDVVSKEMFVIEPHAGADEEERICLRPEATAPTMRAFLEHNVQEKPWKVFSHGPMFRYERPQKGRYRQFTQINVEIINARSIAHDVELITLLDRLFSHGFKLNTYALQLNFLGCPQDRQKFRERLGAFLDKQTELCETCLVRKEKNMLRVFDCKNSNCQKIYAPAPVMTDTLCTDCAQEWDNLKNWLELLSVSFSVNPRLVRGLDYYSKTVFEFVSESLGAQNTFCAGGRYDQLATMLGASHETPALGAALGVERLQLMLEPRMDTLPLPQQPKLVAVLPMSEAQLPLALIVTDTLRAHNICTEAFVDGDSIKSMMRRANRLGATYALLIGDQEQQSQTVTIKHMINGTQEQIAQTDLVSYIAG